MRAVKDNRGGRYRKRRARLQPKTRAAGRRDNPAKRLVRNSMIVVVKSAHIAVHPRKDQLLETPANRRGRPARRMQRHHAEIPPALVPRNRMPRTTDVP